MTCGHCGATIPADTMTLRLADGQRKAKCPVCAMWSPGSFFLTHDGVFYAKGGQRAGKTAYGGPLHEEATVESHAEIPACPGCGAERGWARKTPLSVWKSCPACGLHLGEWELREWRRTRGKPGHWHIGADEDEERFAVWVDEWSEEHPEQPMAYAGVRHALGMDAAAPEERKPYAENIPFRDDIDEAAMRGARWWLGMDAAAVARPDLWPDTKFTVTWIKKPKGVSLWDAGHTPTEETEMGIFDVCIVCVDDKGELVEIVMENDRMLARDVNDAATRALVKYAGDIGERSVKAFVAAPFGR